MKITVIREDTGFLVIVDGEAREVDSIPVTSQFSAMQWEGDLQAGGVAEIEYQNPVERPNELDYDLAWVREAHKAWEGKAPRLVYRVEDGAAIQQTVSDAVPDGYTSDAPPDGHDGMYRFSGGAWVFNVQAARERASLPRRQFFIGLEHMGLYDTVRAMEDDPETPKIVRIEIRESTRFDRNWPTLVQMAQALGYTEADLDQLFGIEAPS